MKVAFINCSYNGSTGGIISGICDALEKQGDQGHVFYGLDACNKRNYYRIGNYFSLHFHSVMSKILGKQGYNSYFATKKLISQLKKLSPDIIHLHNLHGSYLHLPSLFSYLSKCSAKLVLTVHDCWIYTGKCYHYYEAGCDRYLSGCGKCTQLDMYPKSKYFDLTRKMLKDKKKWFARLDSLNIVAVSEWMASQVKSTFLSRFPISVIKNGVKEAFRYIENPEINEDIRSRISGRFVILGVSSAWNGHKGLNDFIELSKKLSDDEVIVLVGDIGEGISLPENIIHIKRTENIEELAAIYNTAGVYVSMSTEESFGLTICEAQCCGLPSIVYRATACPELVCDGVNGYSVTPHDINEVYRRICELKQNNSIVRAEIARVSVEKYSSCKMVDDYLNLYRGIINDFKQEKH